MIDLTTRKPASLIALGAVLALLVLSSQATAAATDSLTSALPPATESSAPAASSAPAPAEQAPSVITTVTSTVEAADPTGVVHSVSAATADDPPAPVDNDSGSTLASVASSTTRQVSGLVERVRQETSETVAATVERTVHVVETETPVGAAVETLRHSSLTKELAKSVPAGETLPPPGTAAEASSGGPLDFNVPPQLNPLSPQGATGVQSPPIEHRLGFIGLERPNGLQLLTSADRNRPGSEQTPTPSSSPVGGAAVTAAATDDFNAPAPLDIPAPAPDSPGAAPGSGGSFFIPLAALLALLALVAPATLRRRLGEVPDFAVPNRFVCALERPG